MKLKIKDQIPDIEIFHLIDGEPQTSKIRDILGNGKVVLFGLPGAFYFNLFKTPSSWICS